MAIIPLKQEVTLRKYLRTNDDGWQVDEWGEPMTIKCRAVEKVEVVLNQLGEEVTAGVKLTFDKLPNIAYDDEITYVNGLGVAIKRNPVSIKPIRMVNGKPTLTTIHL